MASNIRVSFTGAHIFIGSLNKKLCCTLIVDDVLKYMSPQFALTSVAVKLEAITIANHIAALPRLGCCFKIHHGVIYDMASGGTIRRCDPIITPLLIDFALKLQEKIPCFVGAPRGTRSRGHHSPAELWDNMGPQRI